MEEKIRCEVCHKPMKQIQQTSQYYCEQSLKQCYNSLKVVHIE